MDYSDKQIEKLIEDVFSGKVTRRKLPESLYLAIGKYFEKALKEGLSASFMKDKTELITNLRENIWLFSGAKTYQSVTAMESLLTSEGELRTFKEFKEFAAQEYDLYNKTWAAAEYDTAVGQSQMVERWEQIEEDSDVLPLLRYNAVMDANTSEICAPLDGVILPVTDPFWDTYTPLNHYNCRCTIDQLSEGEVTPRSELREKTLPVYDQMNDAFKVNVGKTDEIFDSKHPYFDVPKQDREFAKNNFGLPLPENE